MNVFAMNAKVVVVGQEGMPPRPGVVKGAGFVQPETGSLLPVYIVELAEGFWSPTEDTYISKVVAHPDNMKEVEDNEG